MDMSNVSDFLSSSVDATVLRVDDVHTRETQNRVVLQNLDWRLQRLEDLNMNMYTMIEKFTSRQTHDDEPQGRRKRRASLTSHDLEEQSPQASSNYRFLKPRQSHIPAPRHPHKFKRQSTIRRLNSPTKYQTNPIPIQSNEYTSITDGVKACVFLPSPCLSFFLSPL